MSSQNNTPKYLQQEEALEQESKELISTLPRQNGWFDSSHVYLYQGFWYQPDHLQSIISCRKHFEAQDSDVFLVTFPKCGTTWMKAIIFAILNRNHHPPAAPNHPLLTHNPHDLVLSLEINLYSAAAAPAAAAASPSRRFFSTHMPYSSLPDSVRSGSGSSSKIVYASRGAKDAFVSLWHFMNELRPRESGEADVEEALRMFCSGAVGYGPFWDHVLEYWERSRESSDGVMFVKYEDMKEGAAVEVRRLAEFLDFPFTAEEEEAGVVAHILELTSFESMSSLDVNRVGRLEKVGIENRHFFRKGLVGDWKNYLSAEMAQKIDRIVGEKFSGSGLVM